jgi:hypothetical protein
MGETLPPNKFGALRLIDLDEATDTRTEIEHHRRE